MESCKAVQGGGDGLCDRGATKGDGSVQVAFRYQIRRTVRESEGLAADGTGPPGLTVRLSCIMGRAGCQGVTSQMSTTQGTSLYHEASPQSFINRYPTRYLTYLYQIADWQGSRPDLSSRCFHLPDLP